MRLAGRGEPARQRDTESDLDWLLCGCRHRRACDAERHQGDHKPANKRVPE
jgi:hypothetical protein